MHMIVEAAQELSLLPTETSQRHVVKGKRVNRQRPQSAMPFLMRTNSPTRDGFDNEKLLDNSTNSFSPRTSTTSSFACFRDITEEDEDMANCLVHLAQRQSRELSENDEGDSSLWNDARYGSLKIDKVAAAGDSVRAGLHAFECKTCNKSFGSFQALGGHRTSHKKPKDLSSTAAVDNEKKQRRKFTLSSYKEQSQLSNINENNNLNHRLSLQFNTSGNIDCSNNDKHYSKVHECLFCGAIFTSGQALGGHKRRHSQAINGRKLALSSAPMTMKSDEKPTKKQKTTLSLALDLNLPAPEDDHKKTRFALASKQHQHQQRQPDLVLSNPASVSCHN